MFIYIFTQTAGDWIQGLVHAGKDFVSELHYSLSLQAFKTYINNIHTVGNPSVCTAPGAGDVTQLADVAWAKPSSPSPVTSQVHPRLIYKTRYDGR